METASDLCNTSKYNHNKDEYWIKNVEDFEETMATVTSAVYGPPSYLNTRNNNM